MKKGIILTAILLNFQILSSPCLAHFGMLIPSDSMVMKGESKTIELKLSFSHPFEGQGMDMDRPREFGVRSNGKKQSLIEILEKTRVMEHSAWVAPYKIKRPGVYMFYMEPQPYWEPAEDSFIIHYTKTVLAAFGDDEGWDEEVGLKTEIIPLSKPFGLYAGNVFQGIVKLDGKPVPFAEVEVEYYNKGAKIKAPTAYMIAQTIKSDQNGVFTYAAPAPGWWGFAALTAADYKLNRNGEPKDVELGAVIWVKFHDWK
jgi:cobalt/nickel transport protein